MMRSCLIALALVAGMTFATNPAVAQGRYFGGPSRPSMAKNLESRYYAPPTAQFEHRGSAALRYSYYQGNRYNYQSPYGSGRAMYFDRPDSGSAIRGLSIGLGF